LQAVEFSLLSAESDLLEAALALSCAIDQIYVGDLLVIDPRVRKYRIGRDSIFD
jgi:hypothetical protein